MKRTQEKHAILYGTQLKRRFDKAFADLQTEDVAYLDIKIIEGDIDPKFLRIPLSIKDTANELNLDLTEMLNLVIVNFHNQITGKEESLIRQLQQKDSDFIRRFIQEFKLSLRSV
jgi:hypothetical protein